ncbi:hypothetical protein N7481_000292 [Penicillium waksmanii]|uniref:uncharacterized protein n=1 Tax=Penicillium waksmanii TaxID=69791 RepID=UPI002547F3A3|nr:uncharacterized protein N7481_000292 [Penicillium waksmanii]KAJ5999883.1 hypothetical protein N7481_000292 [Penicillium waksmanii]
MMKKFITDVLASSILSSKVPSELDRSQVLHVRKKFLETGPGALNRRCKYIYDVTSLFDQPVILCIDILCRHMEGGDEDTVDIIQFLEPALGAGQIRCLITTTSDEFNEAISSNDLFYPVLTTQPSIIQTVSLIRRMRNNLEATNNFNIHDDAFIAAANLATHFLPEQPFLIVLSTSLMKQPLQLGWSFIAVQRRQLRWRNRCDNSRLRFLLCTATAPRRRITLRPLHT